MPGRSAAHFLLHSMLANNPLNDALIHAFLEAGLAVDLFVPGGEADTKRYGDQVAVKAAEYGYRWLMNESLSMKWRNYAVFSGTAEDPMAVAGILGGLYGKPVISMADEIRSGSYSGNRSERWKKLCRRGMRASALTIITDPVRVELQRDYARLPPDARFVFSPCCFRDPPRPADAAELRYRLDIPSDALVLGYSGTFSLGNGAGWLLEVLERMPGVHVLGQLVVDHELVECLLGRVAGHQRLHRLSHGPSWREAWSASAAADIGMVVYLQDGPQFRNMGVSSNRLCMFLSMGVPVIASRQPSFRFIEEYDCGVLVDSETEFIAAIDRIRGRRDEMKANALRCAREYIDAPCRYLELRDAIAGVAGITQPERGR